MEYVVMPTSGDAVRGHRVVFVSYAGPDRPWAEWAAAQLEAAGWSAELDVWDWAAGDSIQLRMNQALESADRVLALWSPAYFEPHRFTQDQDILERLRRTLGVDHHNVLSEEENLASLLRALGRHEEAYELSRRTLDRSRKVLGPDHPRTLASTAGIAVDLRVSGRCKEAYELNRDSLAKCHEVFGPGHPLSLVVAHNLAMDLRALSRHQEAHKLDKTTYEARRRVLGSSHPDTLDTARNLVSDLRALGRDHEAQDLAQIIDRLASHGNSSTDAADSVRHLPRVDDGAP
jgi:tetratricopeptide (TPR) repeat protein